MISNALKYGGAAAVALTTVSFLAFSARKSQYQGDKIKLQCSCGKFTGNVQMPTNANHVAGLNVHCHCKDCATWAGQVVKHGALTEAQGDEIYIVYKPTIHFDNPELIRPMRLYEKSTTHRLMTKCCSTAVYSSVHGTPIASLSAAIIAPQDKPALLSRLGTPQLIRMKEKKNEEPYAHMSNAHYDVGGPAFVATYMKFLLQGLLHMTTPPVEENLAKDEIVFPDAK